MNSKYLAEGESGWEDIARRVATHVLEPYFPHLVEPMTKAIIDRKFMPGGRYLYATGKPLHQVQNCALFTVEDSKESIADLFRRVATTLMTGAGVGIVWSPLRPNGADVGGMGGKSTGPVAFMKAVNEIGRNIMQGGSRRSAIWAGLHWNHPDVFEFMASKDWDEITRQGKDQDFNFPAPMDMTNISIILDTAFFEAYRDEQHADHVLAQTVYWTAVEKMLEGGEPGFSVDAWENEGENLRNAPVAAYTKVLTDEGYQSVGDIVGEPTTVWTGKQWARDVVFKETNDSAQTVRVRMTGGRFIDADPSHPFMVERWTGLGSRRRLVSIDRVPAANLREGDILHVSLPETPGSEFSSTEYTLGWLYGDGSFTSGGGAELTLCSPESKECLDWISGFSSITENDSRGYTRMYFSTRQFTDRTKARVPQQDITPSFIAGLFDADGNWEPKQKRIRLASKHEDFLHDVRRGLERLGILAHVSKAGTSTYGKSQGYQLVVASEFAQTFAQVIPTKRLDVDLAGYTSYRHSSVKVVGVEGHVTQPVYCADVKVEEHTFMAEGVIISNCTEITSADDNDICNLGSINLARVESLEEFTDLVSLGTAFLLCGTLYSDIPIEEIGKTRDRNRRLGLGLMGIHDWLIQRGYRYEPNEELAAWLEVYSKSTELASLLADDLGISAPVKTRAIAPTGTIGILAETTTGIEPIFAMAYKRRYLKGTVWHYQYVVDGAAHRLVEAGIDPDTVDTAADLAKDPARRLSMQAFVQQYVDHGISSTLNLPRKEEQVFDTFEFGTTLMQYLPSVRGVTVYPDGARSGQPLNVVPYSEAKDWVGYEYEEVGLDQSCVSGSCGL